MTESGIRDGHRLLSRVMGILAEPLDVEDMLNALATSVIPDLGDCCAIHLLGDTTDPVLVAAQHVSPDRVEAFRRVVEASPVTLDQPFGPGAVMASGRSQALPRIDDALLDSVLADGDMPARFRALNLQASYTAPLLSQGRVLGSLALSRTRTDEWTADERELIDLIAERAGGAVENAQLRAQVDSLGQLMLDLQSITAVLADATTVEDVTAAVIDRVRVAISADSAVIATCANSRVDALASIGLPEQRMQPWRVLTLRGLTPDGYAVETGKPVFVGNSVELAEAFPDAVGIVPGEAHAALPLRRYNGTPAVMRFDWNSPRTFAPAERGLLASVAQQVAASLERASLIVREHEARAVAEASQRRTDLLAEVTHSLASNLDVDRVLERLAEIVVPRLADLCTIDLIADPGDPPSFLSAEAVNPRVKELLHVTDSILPRRENPHTMIGKMLATGLPVFAPVVSEVHLRRISTSEEQAQMYFEMGIISGCVVPLRARGQVLGALSMFTTKDSGRVYDESDAELITEVGRRAGLQLDNARLFTREHDAAETLQRSLLPELPTLPGIEAAARYLPAAAHAGVGGDLFDLFALPDGAIGVAIGDVMGHDMRAAAAMGQLRSVLRSYAWEGVAPGIVLDRMDLLVQSFEMAQLATALYARLEARPGDEPGRLLRYANAGHLPPVVQYPDGTVRLLEEGQSVLIGAPSEHARAEAVENLPVGSTLLLYTDGLIELRHRSIDDGIADLLAVVKAHEPAAGAEALCSAVEASIDGKELTDDVALLAVRLL
ncbi:MAG: SpoIIE family protein phosphatase [Mycobacteriales bacterium]